MATAVGNLSIPDDNTVIRYCRPSSIDAGELLATAFMLRDQEEFLSVNWLERLTAEYGSAPLIYLREILIRKKLAVSPKGRFAQLHVGEIRSTLYPRLGLYPRVQSTPSPSDASHGGIFDLENDPDVAAEMLLAIVSVTHAIPAT